MNQEEKWISSWNLANSQLVHFSQQILLWAIVHVFFLFIYFLEFNFKVISSTSNLVCRASGNMKCTPKSHVWTDNEIELLLNISLEYEANKVQESAFSRCSGTVDVHYPDTCKHPNVKTLLWLCLRLLDLSEFQTNPAKIFSVFMFRTMKHKVLQHKTSITSLLS